MPLMPKRVKYRKAQRGSRLESKERIYAVDGTKYCSRVPMGRARASQSEVAKAPSGNPEIKGDFLCR